MAGFLAAEHPGPAAFACAYLNGRSDAVPPLLLALDGLDDVSALLTAAAGALQRGGVHADPKIVFTPDGAVVPKAARISELRPNCVLVLSCGEPFHAASVPERARRMHATQQKQTQKLGPQVRAEQQQLPGRSSGRTVASPSQRDQSWKFSPSGRWASPLALRPGRRT